MIRYTTALRCGTAEPESILRRFTRNNVQHPTYRALVELGKAIKTTFLARYLHEESLRREVNEGLNVVENWNSANGFIFYGKSGEFASNKREDQEVVAEPMWQGRLTPTDLRALTPLKWLHVNPYRTFTLNMHERLPLAHAA